MRLTHSVLLRAPQEAVFDFYADPHGAAIADPSVRVTVLTDGRLGVGTRSRIEGRGSPFEVEITAYDRPSLLAFRMSHPGRPETIEVSQRFATVPDGTEISSEAAYHYPGGLLGALFTLARPILERTMRRNARRIAGVAGAHIRAATRSRA